MGKIIGVGIISSLIFIGGCKENFFYETLQFNGKYDVIAKSIKNRNECKDAKGYFYIKNGIVNGELISQWGNRYKVSGEINEDGKIKGGFAQSGELVAKFNGELYIESNRTKGEGRWIENSGCEGVWGAIKIE